MAKNLFNRYIWLVDTIYRNGKLSFKEINDKWLQTDFSEGKPIPLRTFHNHREAIQDLFDINIECNKSTHEYYIEDADQLTEPHFIRKCPLRTKISDSDHRSYAGRKKNFCYLSVFY